jgi:thymidylate synthase
LPYNELLTVVNIPYPHLEDEEERNYLLSRTRECIDLFKDESQTRQAVYSNLYQNNMGKCISLIQFFIHDELCLNAYIRSQESKNNFMYDYQTMCLLIKKVSNEIIITPGKITIFTTNFHVTLESDLKNK